MAGEMISFPMDATKYTAEDFGFWLGERTRGIYSHKDSSGEEEYFKVMPSSNGGMAVTVADGIAWLKMKDFWGVSSLLSTTAGNTELTLGASDTSLNRVDAVCVQLNKKTYKSNVIIKAGTPATSPVLPTRINDDDYDEIYVASIYVGKGVVAITADNITDLRGDSEYCGYMTDAVVTDAQKLGGLLPSEYVKYENQKTQLAQYATDYFTLAGGYNLCYAVKKNGFITITSNGRWAGADKSATSGTAYTILNLPTELVPASDTYFAVSVRSANVSPLSGAISDSGEVKLRQAGTVSNCLTAFCVTYPANN